MAENGRHAEQGEPNDRRVLAAERREGDCVRRLAVLHELACKVASGTDLPSLYSTVANGVAELLNVERCLILVADEAGMLHPAGSASSLQDNALPFPDVPHDPRDDPLQAAMSAGRTVYGDSFAKLGPGPLSTALAEARIDPGIAIELRHGTHHIGVLLACGAKSAQSYSADDCRLMETIAALLSSAINSANIGSKATREGEMLERQARRAQAIARVGEVTAQSLDLESVLETVADLTTRELGADMLLIWLSVEGREGLSLAAHRHCPPELVAMVGKVWPHSPSVAGLAIRSGQVQVVEDVAALGGGFGVTQTTAAMGGFRSIVAVPLMAQGTLVGHLNYMLKDAHRFGAEEIEAIATIGNQFAIALRNAQLYSKTREVNRQLAVANHRLTALVEQLPEGVLLADEHGHIVLCNDAATDIAGDKMAVEGALHHTDFIRFCMPDGRPARSETTPIARVLDTGMPVTGEQWRYERHGDDRELHVLVNCAPLHDENGALAGAVAVCQDVTDLRRVERMKDEFLAVASHELRTPLTSAKGYTQAIIMRLDQRLAGSEGEALPACRTECQRDRQQLQIALRQINRLSELIRELLDNSRLEGGGLDLHLAPVNMIQLAEGVVARLRENSDRHEIRVVSDASPALAAVRGDEDRLDQVLTNLLENAIKYSPTGGKVLVDLRVLSPAQAKEIAGTRLPPNGDSWVVVKVQDEGVGIPADQLHQVFQRFYRASNALVRRFGGLGLGLHISREIISRHGGQMWAESEEHKGSSFFFALPIVA